MVARDQGKALKERSAEHDALLINQLQEELRHEKKKNQELNGYLSLSQKESMVNHEKVIKFKEQVREMQQIIEGRPTKFNLPPQVEQLITDPLIIKELE